MTRDTSRWDAADSLETKEDIAAYLDAVLEDGDPDLLKAALGDIARAKGMTEIAQAAGLGRANLYKALSPEGKPGVRNGRQSPESPRPPPLRRRPADYVGAVADRAGRAHRARLHCRADPSAICSNASSADKGGGRSRRAVRNRGRRCGSRHCRRCGESSLSFRAQD
jgi:probable addiction module antidote protein